ncbi:hypothetical protein C8P63_12013 [Melghirimyces profundicolus]|uniref:DUF7916 domain-containing protein n=1 Tax=Melghirimyces profundicolus TaxID=1242148 RepID=A0A2T6BGN4_9BACL|nr:PEP phosphonomutase [Melghirimyces profundicolus]PTX55219.1 hypothetical protein C8P63_12013 [Melghirimyces profundicolus]
MEKKTRRLLDLSPSELSRLSGRELLASVKAAEGRTVMAETVVSVPPLVDGCSNPELAAAFGADLLLLNLYDVEAPRIGGFPSSGGSGPDSETLARYGLSGAEGVLGWGVTAGDVRRMTGRPVGINLEPVPEEAPLTSLAPGRKATVSNAIKAVEQGAAFLVLTGNPGTGVTWSTISEQVRVFRKELGSEFPLMAGKMHGAGSWENRGPWLGEEELERLAAAGTDVLLLPQPGTVPGADRETVRKWVNQAHRFGMMALLTIGTSQESADSSLLERLALEGKAAGGDLFHIGDAGFSGMAPPENILAYSVALRGKRHTYRRMAQSLLKKR